VAYSPQLNAANVNVEVLVRTPPGDPLYHGICTLGLWAGSDVLGIDDSEKTTTPGTNIPWNTTDANIAGIAAAGTRDWRIRDLVAMYGKAPLTGERVGAYKFGKVRVRVADDISAVNIGDIYQAAADSQTIEGVAAQTVGVADNMAWEVITAAGATAADIVNLHTDISQVLGWATEAVAAASGGDEDDRRAAMILFLQPYRLLTSA
jgi:hypothetical protein